MGNPVTAVQPHVLGEGHGLPVLLFSFPRTTLFSFSKGASS